MTRPLVSRELVFTIVFGMIGTACFWIFDLPLPFLFGPMAASLVYALMGGRPRSFGKVSTFARTILGVAIGASITPEVVERLPAMIKSVSLIPLYLVVIGFMGYAYFRRFQKFDPVTAYFSAMPGGLQDMILFGEEAGGNPRTLSLIHATRVLIIVTAAPVVLTWGFDVALRNPIGSPAASLPWHEIVLMLVAALGGWQIAARLRMFGASILGPLIAAALLALSGLIHSRPPAEALLFSQFAIGAGIGVHYVGVTLRELRQVVGAGVLYVVLLAIVAAMFAAIANQFGLAAPVEALLAFMPAGQAEITILTIVAGADLGFVITHHIVRITLVILGAPLFARRIRDSKPQD